MNERIKELATQARNYALDQKHIHEQIHNTEQCMESYREVYNEKFAELIVRECMRICKDVEYFDIYDDPEKNGHIRAGAAMCREDIKQHFGVE